MFNRWSRTVAAVALASMVVWAVAGVAKSLWRLQQLPLPLPPRVTLQDSEGHVAFGFSPDGRTLAGISIETQLLGPLRLWDTTTGLPRVTVPPALRWPPIHFSPDSKLLAIEGPGVLQLWEVETGKQRASVDLGKNRYHFNANFRFSPDGRTLAVGTVGMECVKLLDLGTGKERATLEGAARAVRP